MANVAIEQRANRRVRDGDVVGEETLTMISSGCEGEASNEIDLVRLST